MPVYPLPCRQSPAYPIRAVQAKATNRHSSFLLGQRPAKMYVWFADVWFPDWAEYEAAHPIQAQRVYLSLGDREEHTKNKTMAAVGDNIRALHSTLTRCGKDCRLEWNAGGHFKDADLRTARAFAWIMEGKP